MQFPKQGIRVFDNTAKRRKSKGGEAWREDRLSG